MEDTDRIYGGKRFALFDQLQKNRIVVKLSLLGEEYERLTIINGVVTENETPYVIIDIPIGFRETLQDEKKKKVLFDFIGNDKILYSFSTMVGRINENDIWIEFPEFIEKVQRRKFYRIAPPVGTKIYFEVDFREYEASVVNLSEGGLLITQSEQFQKEVKLSDGEYVKNINLICEEQRLRFQIGIKEGVIKRLVKNPNTSRYTYAIQFIGIEDREKKELQDWIFRVQREFLRKQSLL